MYDHLASLYENFSLARTIYSLILLSIIVLLIGHLVSIWSAGKISIWDFSYFTNGKKDIDHAEQLRSETSANYSRIVGLVKSYEAALSEEAELEGCATRGNTWYRQLSEWFGNHHGGQAKKCSQRDQGGTPIDVARLASVGNFQSDKLQEVAKTLDISVEGVSLKGLFSAFGNLVAPPQTELTASVYDSDNSRRAYVEVAGDSSSSTTRELTASVPAVSLLDTPGKDGDSAFRIACYLIWIQINKNASRSSHLRVSFEEFCDWARMLSITSDLKATDSYRLEAKKSSPDIEFVKSRAVLATRQEISFRDIYVSLSDLRHLIGEEIIKLNEETEATFGSVGDLFGFFALVTGNKIESGKDATGWISSLKSPVTDSKVVNEAYFGPAIRSDCDPAASAPAFFQNVKSNIVEISNGLNANGFWTGWIVEDEKVLTITTDLFMGTDSPADQFTNAMVRLVGCGNAATVMPISSATWASQKQGTPYVILTVPGLKRSAKPPKPAAEGLRTGTTVFVAGVAAQPRNMFTNIPRSNRTSAAPANERVIQIISGAALAPYDHGSTWDDEKKFYLDTPFALGLSGSPIFDGKGELVGFVGFGFPVGDKLYLSVGTTITTLKDLRSLNEGLTSGGRS